MLRKEWKDLLLQVLSENGYSLSLEIVNKFISMVCAYVERISVFKYCTGPTAKDVSPAASQPSLSGTSTWPYITAETYWLLSDKISEAAVRKEKHKLN